MFKGSACRMGPAKGIDTIQAMTLKQTKLLKQHFKTLGILWIARYAPRDHVKVLNNFETKPSNRRKGSGNLSKKESEFLRVDCNLKILPVQRRTGSPLGSGRLRGRVMVRWALQMGIPLKVHLWCDLEGRGAENAGKKRCLTYLDEWSTEVTRFGYNAGLYLARPLPWRTRKGGQITAKDLDRLKNKKIFTCFWRSGQKPPVTGPSTGFDIVQQYISKPKPPKSIYYIAGPDIIQPRNQKPILWGR